MEVASKFSTNSGPTGTFLPAILHYYLNDYQFEKGDNPFFIFENMKSENVTIAGINVGKEIPLRIFAFVCLAIISLPASEAMCERCFAQIKAIATDFNKSMKEDFFSSLATIKICMRYQRSYYFDTPNQIEFEEEEEEEDQEQ